MGFPLIVLQVNVPDLTGTNADEYPVAPPFPGKWRLEYAVFVPQTALATDASNYATLTIRKGTGGSGDSCGAITTNSSGGAANVKGTRRDLALSGGKALEIDSSTTTDCHEATITKAGSGGTFGGTLFMGYSKLPGDS